MGRNRHGAQERVERLSVRLTPGAKKWLQEEAARQGIPQGAVLEVVIEQYRAQRDLLRALPQLLEAVQKLESMQAAGGRVPSGAALDAGKAPC